ncbi:hypothetical protein E2C01_010590 [Portunus trituberculatus]|uniref:Uncharacterized protein n=1 Tax=Portunus trituberculatus TaxID=210409 RepID=A0A5B7D958_PORTR|nr:hypothetical protein [Portunus trituberculatus]
MTGGGVAGNGSGSEMQEAPTKVFTCQAVQSCFPGGGGGGGSWGGVREGGAGQKETDTRGQEPQYALGKQGTKRPVQSQQPGLSRSAASPVLLRSARDAPSISPRQGLAARSTPYHQK